MEKNLRIFVIIAGGCWMLGEGVRMVVMSLFYPNWHYVPNTFDMFFDWVPLVVLGSIFFLEGIKTFYVNQVEQNKSENPALISIKNKHRNRFKATRFPK